MSKITRLILISAFGFALLHSVFPPRIEKSGSYRVGRQFIGSEFFHRASTEKKSVEGFPGQHTFGAGPTVKVDVPMYVIGLTCIFSVSGILVLLMPVMKKDEDHKSQQCK